MGPKFATLLKCLGVLTILSAIALWVLLGSEGYRPFDVASCNPNKFFGCGALDGGFTTLLQRLGNNAFAAVPSFILGFTGYKLTKISSAHKKDQASLSSSKD